ncbi:hypothetical protein M409DRAFT_22369 [Zasmidium cellare ATCC 36951]|uniref:Major facilitator superfamily (MFS) profile domain-containing protein n=1 Tax=Zasmidium cellare ATCC 36951 TaxID=1080233 RepID=A0A6A6CK09_ZASCE|nr:uncharacterized protein M409DRAFT_22369 [Zasmidium cellare ATCC 36951]KAF2167564.1 hypothetical protein M409DRAFT_22369 [Zasmidium cellare ATCC 36951]
MSRTSSPDLKATTDLVEDVLPTGAHTNEEFSKQDRDLVHRIDWHLMPWLSLLYLASFLDRTNVGQARIAGLQADLQMTDAQFNTSLALFFVIYAVFEPISNVFIGKIRPNVDKFFVARGIILWSIVCICQGLVKDFAGMAAVRWFLGVFEAGLYPGVAFILSCFYKKSEFGVRTAIFVASAAFAGSFGGLLPAAILQMDGVGGYPGWAWIFIIEGLATFVLGVASFFMVQDFPETAKFLSEEDRARLFARLAEDDRRGDNQQTFKWKYVWDAVSDWKTWTGSITTIGCSGGLYAFSLFLPTVLRGLGFSVIRTNLLSVAPYAAGALFTIFIGFVSDRLMRRGLIQISTSLLGVIGFTLLVAHVHPWVKYGGSFLATMGVYPCVPHSLVWISNNIEGFYKRGIVFGICIGLANLQARLALFTARLVETDNSQGVVISYLFPASDAPAYRAGNSTALGYVAIGITLGSMLQYVLLSLENRARRAGKRDARIENKSEEEIAALGDKRPDFFYVL